MWRNTNISSEQITSKNEQPPEKTAKEKRDEEKEFHNLS